MGIASREPRITGRAALAPQRELLGDDGVLVDPRVDLAGAEDQLLLRELEDEAAVVRPSERAASQAIMLSRRSGVNSRSRMNSSRSSPGSRMIV